MWSNEKTIDDFFIKNGLLSQNIPFNTSDTNIIPSIQIFTQVGFA
jgi:hypothetical protein